MSIFDLSNKNISATFQNLLQTVSGSGELYNLVGEAVGLTIVEGDTAYIDIKPITAGGSVPADRLHSREGTLYWGDTVLADGTTITGLLNVNEDLNPKLGGVLDLNTYDITGSGNIYLSGDISASGTIYSDNIQVGSSIGGSGINANNINATRLTASAFLIDGITANEDFFLVKSGSYEAMKVNNQGVFTLGAHTYVPEADDGGFYFNGGDKEFYLGK